MNSLLVINSFICAAVFWHAICSLNLMPKTTKGWENQALKLFYVLLGFSATLVLFGPLYGYWEPQLGEVLITASFLSINILSFYQRHKRQKLHDRIKKKQQTV